MQIALFVPCYIDQFTPQVALATARILAHLGHEVVVPPGQTCCGQPTFNTGYWPETRHIARHFLQVFAGYDTIVAPSGGCVGMVAKNYPWLFEGQPEETPAREMAGRVHEFTSFLVDRLGVTDLGAKLEAMVTLHDSCHAKMLGNEFYKQVRRIFAWAGVEVIEMEKTKIRSLCCGFASIAPRFNPVDVVTQGRGRVAEARRSGADALAVYCNGCGVLFSVINRYSPQRIKVYHLIELLDLACGHEPAHMSHQNAGRLAAATARTLLKSRLGSGKPDTSFED